jgi:hypothetical protein
MKILSCITNIKEIELLKKEGVDEIYFGLSYRYIPNYANLET